MIQIDIPMPDNCEECDERGIRQLLWCRLIHSGCANCGRHPKCPLKEVPSGKWMLERAIVRCSNCGKGYKEAFGKPSAVTFNYCPNCGAKMGEEQTGENT